MPLESTICALATPGHGAISVIRVSGPDSISIVESIFKSAIEGKLLQSQAPNTIHFGTIQHDGEVVDEVLVSLFKAPHSYTGEDSIEISCHGSPYIQQKILELLVVQGATPAKPGEFTQRAFLNGKMDLSQAEAVADLIAAESEGAHRVALQQLRGGFSDRLKSLREQLLHFISLIELELDFSEEDVEFADRSQLTGLVNEIRALIIGSFYNLRRRSADHCMGGVSGNTIFLPHFNELLFRLDLGFPFKIHSGLGVGGHIQPAIYLSQRLDHSHQRQLGAMVVSYPFCFL